jgi:hypothetical protein
VPDGPAREVWKARRLLGLEFIRRLLIRSLVMAIFAPINTIVITQCIPLPSKMRQLHRARCKDGGRVIGTEARLCAGIGGEWRHGVVRCDIFTNTEPSGHHQGTSFNSRLANSKEEEAFPQSMAAEIQWRSVILLKGLQEDANVKL